MKLSIAPWLLQGILMVTAMLPSGSWSGSAVTLACSLSVGRPLLPLTGRSSTVSSLGRSALLETSRHRHLLFDAALGWHSQGTEDVANQVLSAFQYKLPVLEMMRCTGGVESKSM